MMWCETNHRSYGDKDCSGDQYVKETSLQLMKDLADSINSYVKEKEEEKESKEKSCSCD